MGKYVDYLARIQWLQTFVDLLQNALGWQVDVEKASKDEREYEVTLHIKLKYQGRVWPDIVRNSSYQRVVFEAIKNRLYELWEQEKLQTEMRVIPPVEETARKGRGKPLTKTNRLPGGLAGRVLHRKREK